MSFWRRDQMSAVGHLLEWGELSWGWGESRFLRARVFDREGGRGSLIERA